MFAALSVLFGSLTIVATPPLRGPDEAAHFLRVYGIAYGDLVPAEWVEGRLGVSLPADLYDDYAFLEFERQRVHEGGFSYRGVLAEHRGRRERPIASDVRAPVFVPYQGSEAYSPAPYLPYVAVALASRVVDFDFVAMVYLMRAAGLLALTAVAAYAIAVVPRLKWCFLLIAMWPAALYGRSVISADGATLSLSLVAVAFSLRAALDRRRGRLVERSMWMALCVLSKPPQLVFLLLESMAALNQPGREWLRSALVVLPGLLLGPLWIALGSGEMAAWRQAGVSPQEIDPVWKLGFMWEHPLHFPAALLASVTGHAMDLWRQLVGVLGWLDTPLQPLAYPMLSLLLLATAFDRFGGNRFLRAQIALVAGLTALGYGVCVYLILFLTWTPIASPVIPGVQGRYFVPALPLVAVMLGALVDRPLPWLRPAHAALVGALISGIATVEAIARSHWI